ncbi:MAG: hypothetical protein F6K19_34540 [Cyanothece sp. SIO1E1]|nr:hypothetical protein [Cyanothece sp. SIO1E1]
MNIPVILDIAIGLLFLYLLLSLLASELQEMITTLFQWRAEHLKKSIAILLAGDSQNLDDTVADFADKLYENPLMRGLNQQAAGNMARFFRQITAVIATLYRQLTRTRNVFGQQTSGPSYVPADTFARSLLENLNLELLGQQLSELRLRAFSEEQVQIPIHNIVSDLKASLGDESLLEFEAQQLQSRIEQIIADFLNHKATLPESVDRILEQLDYFMATAREVLPPDNPLVQTFLRRLDYLKRNILSSKDERNILLKKIEPTVTEVVAILEQKSPIAQKVLYALRQNPEIAKNVLFQLEPSKLPKPLKDSLYSLAERAQAKTQGIGNGMLQLQSEVETWFNDSMDRASGVYKRNSRGIALLIGFLIAVTINADTLHIVHRLSTDPALRTTIIQATDQVTAGDPATFEQDLETMRQVAQENLEQLPLPIGHSQVILQQQAAAEVGWQFPVPKRYLGWLLTGIAISMGASFWFDLLSRVMKVRGTGNTAGSENKNNR